MYSAIIIIVIIVIIDVAYPGYIYIYSAPNCSKDSGCSTAVMYTAFDKSRHIGGGGYQLPTFRDIATVCTERHKTICINSPSIA